MLTDPELISAVLTSCGWTYEQESTDPTEFEPAAWYCPNGQDVGPLYSDEILTSLDACHEVFEKDAPDEYWQKLYRIANAKFANGWEIGKIVSKATPRQRCLAWLKFKGEESE